MNSALYECTVSHERLSPKRHAFSYRLFSFALDLDEVDAVAARIPWFSHNQRNLYAFFDADHVDCGRASARENVIELLRQHGVGEPSGRITLVTNVRIAGYVFNPVSFFFVDDVHGQPLAAVAEVNNTFGETKPFVMTRERLLSGRFHMRVPKEFYISPFVALDAELHLRLAPPRERVGFVIDTYEHGEKVLHATMRGVRHELSAGRLAWFTFRYPLMTAGIIAAIHWQALRLFLKRVHFYKKSEHPELQTGIHHPPGPENLLPFQKTGQRKRA